MSALSSRQTLPASILDRLTSPDDKPVFNKIAVPTPRDLNQTIARDLENLLNTRWRCQSSPPELAELDRSLVNYGIPDYCGANSGGSTSREEFRRIVERAIVDFEPRFAAGTVEMTIANDPAGRMLRLRIDAHLRAETAIEPVSFEAALDMVTAAFNVTVVSSVTRVA
jgi:type VI secretion system protein ImpF